MKFCSETWRTPFRVCVCVCVCVCVWATKLSRSSKSPVWKKGGENEREGGREVGGKRTESRGRSRSIDRWYIYLQGEMSCSLDVFVWHIRQTTEPTETKLRVSRCCWPSPRDICCVSQSFKLQEEPSGPVTGSIGMPCSWSKLTGIEEKDTHPKPGAYVWSSTLSLRVYLLHPLPPTLPPIRRNGRLSVKFAASNID